MENEKGIEQLPHSASCKISPSWNPPSVSDVARLGGLQRRITIK
jgi:hypothetical protein